MSKNQKSKLVRPSTGIIDLMVDTEVEIEYVIEDDQAEIVAVWMGFEDVTTAFMRYYADELYDAVYKDTYIGNPDGP